MILLIYFNFCTDYYIYGRKSRASCSEVNCKGYWQFEQPVRTRALTLSTVFVYTNAFHLRFWEKLSKYHLAADTYSLMNMHCFICELLSFI